MRRTVRDVMTEHVVVARDSTRFKDLVRLLGANRVSAVPVVDEQGVLVGIVSEADLLLKEEGADLEEPKVFQSRRRRVERAKAAGATAAEVMTTHVVTTRPDASVAEAARLMHERGVKRLPVVDEEGRVVGIVSRGDLLAVFLRPDEDIRREIIHEVLVRTLWVDPDTILVGVHDGVVDLRGQVERKSLVGVLLGLVRGIDGVVAIHDDLAFQVDDDVLTPAAMTPWVVGARNWP